MQSNLAGQPLGPYKLIRLIGEGGMGSVYESYQSSTKRKVAVKVLPRQLASNPNYRERFMREVELAASLEHIHILPIYDHGIHEGVSYIVMRYLSGGDLQQRLRKFGRPSVAETLKLLGQISDALDYAHNQGVVHRDLKASNIMFDDRGNAYLVDFGVAKVIGDVGLTGTGQAIGTPAYMAPEQWQGLPVDARTDVYALAIMTYQMLTGEIPFNAPTPAALMFKHLNEMPTPANVLQPSLSEAVHMVIAKSLAKRPDDRHPSAGDFVQNLVTAMANIPKHETVDTGFMTLQLDTKPPFSTAATDDGEQTFTPTTGGSSRPHTPISAGGANLEGATVTTGGGASPASGRKISWPLVFGVLIGVIGVSIGVLLALNGGGGDDDPTSTPSDLVAAAPSATEAESISTSATPSDILPPTDEPAEPTPDITLTLNAGIMAAIQSTNDSIETMTAAAPTDTPTDAPTLTDTPTETPNASQTAQFELDLTITVEAAQTFEVQQTLVARAQVLEQETQVAQLTADAPTNTPQPSPTDTPTETPTATPTDTPSATATETATPTDTPDETATERFQTDLTATANSGATQVAAALIAQQETRQAQQTADAPTATVTSSPTDTHTPTATPSATDTASPEPTATDRPTATATPEPTEIALGQPAPNMLNILEYRAELIGFEPVARNEDWDITSQTFDGVPMVLVPAGCFMMGWGGEDSFPHERPEHEQCIEVPYWIDRYEVSNEQFNDLGGRAARPSASNGADLPRVSINWFEALAYCEQRGGRLPTELEWEYAARGPNNYRLPWGDEIIFEYSTSEQTSGGQTAPVDSLPAGMSWVGAYNMSGNAWEWISSRIFDYPYTPLDGRENLNIRDNRGLRGGAWNDPVLYLHGRPGVDPGLQTPNVGLRCVRNFNYDPETLGEVYVTQNADWLPIVERFNTVEMVLVPAGCFMMGREDGEADEQPVHEQCFERPFWMDRYEVTNEQFNRFSVPTLQVSSRSGALRPRERISWFEATAYCENRGMRLPTEAEWEYAARGPDALIYPWGDNFDPDNMASADGNDASVNVGLYPNGRSWVGALDMLGNVWEWTASAYAPYPYAATDGRENAPANNRDARVLRGASFLDAPLLISGSDRGAQPADSRHINVGLRCVGEFED